MNLRGHHPSLGNLAALFDSIEDGDNIGIFAEERKHARREDDGPLDCFILSAEVQLFASLR